MSGRPHTRHKQDEVFKAIRAYKHVHGESPSIDELSAMTKISKGMVHMSLRRLEKEDGLITHSKWQKRSIEIIGSTNLESVDPKYLKRARKLNDKSRKAAIADNSIRLSAVKRHEDAMSEKERIDAVVAKAKAKELAGQVISGDDVMMRSSKPYDRRTHVRSVRVG